jgi:peptide/nickel transport system substrate-binding protein
MNSVWLNLRMKPWDDARVRRAVLRATNRDEYMQFVSRGAGQHVGLVSPFLQGYALPDDELKKLQPFDAQEARRLFDAAAVKEFSFSHPTSGDMSEYVNIFVRQMQAAGVSAKPEPLDTATWVASMFQSRLSASLNINQEYANPDLALHFHVTRGVTGNGRYDTGFSDPEVDGAVRRAATTLEERARKQAYGEAQRVIYRKDPAMFFLFAREIDMLQAKALKGVHRGVGSLWTAFLPDYWLDRA